MLLAAFVVPLAGFWRQGLAYGLALVAFVLSLGASLAGLAQAATVGELRYFLGGWPAPLGIEYVLDPLSGFVAVVVAGVGLVSLVYARPAVARELPGKAVPTYSLILLLVGGLLGIVLTGDLFNLFVFLEIASVAAYALVAVGGRRATVAAFRYLLLGTLGGSLYLLGVGYLYFLTGSLNMVDVAERLAGLHGSPATLAALALIVIGLALKMALYPLHVWLPDAYSYAPTAVAALLAGIVTKVMAYALIRMLLTVFGLDYVRDALPVTAWIAWFAAAGIVIGSLLAIAQRDFRRMLAYSSVSQLGYIGLGIGLANPFGLIGALLHILNHAMLKAGLFMVAGSIDHRTGQREIGKFAGLGREMPWSAATTVLTGYALIGLPPALGFFSKWYLALGSIQAGNWVFVGVILGGSLLTTVYVFRVLEQLYLAKRVADDGSGGVTEAPAEMVVPGLVLGLGVVLGGFANALLVAHVLELAVIPGL